MEMGTYRMVKGGTHKRETTLGKAKRYARNTMIVGMMAGGVYGFDAINSINKLEATNAPTITIDKSSEMYALKVEGLKDALVKDLISCESPGDTMHTLPVIEDNNKEGTLKRSEVVSIGALRFKVGTVIGYYKQMTAAKGEAITLTPTEAVILALDLSRASELAKFIIFDTPKGDKGVDNWRICAAKLKLHARVEAIKQLTQ